MLDRVLARAVAATVPDRALDLGSTLGLGGAVTAFDRWVRRAVSFGVDIGVATSVMTSLDRRVIRAVAGT